MGGGPAGRLCLLGLCLLACLLVGVLTLDAGEQGARRVVTVHHQQTIVTLRLDPSGGVTRCETIEVNFPEQERLALANISRLRPVTPVTLPQMLRTLLACQRLDAPRRQQSADRAPPSPAPRQSWPALTMLRGLVPGTKWCGLGDTASGWNDLGSNADLDRCCRTHDLCPVKVKSYKRRYGLFNWGVYTKSHCACDQEFYRCLKSSAAAEADHVGRLFFDLLQPQCVQGHSCAPHEPPDDCLERQKATGRPSALQFFDQPQRYDEDRLRGGARGQGRNSSDEVADSRVGVSRTENSNKAITENEKSRTGNWRDRGEAGVYPEHGGREALDVEMDLTSTEVATAGSTTPPDVAAAVNSARASEPSAGVTVKYAAVGATAVGTAERTSRFTSFFRRLWSRLG